MSANPDLLPSRREEGWRWSDLRAALRDAPPPQGPRASRHPLEWLAGADGAPRAIAAGEAAHLEERLEGEGPLLARAAAFDLGPGARLTRIVTQPAAGNVVTSFVRVRLAEGAAFHQFVLAEGAKLARIETEVEIAGPGAEVSLNGVYLAGAGRHADLTSTVLHGAPSARTNQLVKGAARQSGRGVFQGRIEVARDAQQTDARQGCHALLLEEGAEVFAKPELVIYADDVQCAHGNTVGGLPEDQVFYLRSRGVPAPVARALLTEAFLAEAISDWIAAPMREALLAQVRAWLGGPAYDL